MEDSPASAPAPPASAQPSVNQLKQWLPLYVKKADTTISRLNRCVYSSSLLLRLSVMRIFADQGNYRILSTSAGTDTVLLTLNYTLLTLLSTLEIYSRRRIQLTALALAEKASVTLLPGETLIATITDNPTGTLHRATKQLRALTDLIADVRIFARLWGLLGVWEWGAQTWREPPKDGILKRIAWMQIVVNVLFQGLENGAYLAQHRVLSWTEQRQTRAWIWSSRFWAAHVVLDLGRLWRLRTLSRTGEAVGALTDAEGKKEEKMERRSKEDGWWRQLYVNAAYAPLTLHWSLESGAVGDLGVGLLGSVAGLVGLANLWRETA